VALAHVNEFLPIKYVQVRSLMALYIWPYTYGSYTSLFKLRAMPTNTPMSVVVIVIVVVTFVLVDINDNNNNNNNNNNNR